MSLYTIAGTNIAAKDRKTTVYRLKACEIVFFEYLYLGVHSNAFPFSLACMWVWAYSVQYDTA